MYKNIKLTQSVAVRGCRLCVLQGFEHTQQCKYVGCALLKDPGSSETVEPGGSLNTPPDSGSPKDHFQEGAKDEQVSWSAYWLKLILVVLKFWISLGFMRISEASHLESQCHFT